MFSGIWNWFFGKRDGSRWDMFAPKERLIYTFYNGTELVKVDPMPIYREIMAKGPELDADLKLARSIHPDAPKGYAAAQEKFRGFFDLKTYKEGGLTETETANLFDHFWDYCEYIKKNSTTLADSLEETSPPMSPSPDKNPPTSSGSASGSINEELSISKPPASPTA